MKYKHFKTLGFSMLLAMSPAILAAPIQVDHQIIEVDSRIIKDKTLVEMHALAELLDVKITHNKENNTVGITDDNTSIAIWLEDGLASISKKEGVTTAVMHPVSYLVDGGKIFLPLRFIGENMGMKIGYKNRIPSIQSPKTNSLSYDFEQDDAGFYPIFADYHDDGNNFESYQMTSKYGDIPVSGHQSKGLYIASMNRSDDLFMGYVKKIEGLESNKEYTFDVQFKLATNQEAGMIGAGGSPAESVFVKCGIVSIEPKVTLNTENNIYRMNLDIGSQMADGKDMQMIGNIAKPAESEVQGFDFKPFEAIITAKTDDKGAAYLVIGTDSGFEGFTEYYIDDVEISY